MESSKPLTQSETPSWLTKDYLEEVLRLNLDDPGITITNFDVRATVVKGDNYASVIHRVTATYLDGKNNHLKESLIVKSLPSGEIVQRFLKEMHLFDKESSAYSKLIPAMNSLAATPLFSPRFYVTDREDTVILEDLSPQSFKMADRKKRLDLAHSILALKALARFHGLSLAVLQRDPTMMELFPEPEKSERMKEMEKTLLPKMYNDLASVIEAWPGYERFAEKIISSRDEIQKRETESQVPKKGSFNVLNHGDFWVNNMLFRYNEESSSVEDVCLIDLQMVKYGSPALDLQYFLTSSLEDGIREEQEDSLLEVYHQALAETLESAGLDHRTYSLEDLNKDYDEKAPYGFQRGIFVLGAVAADPSEAFVFDDFTEESLKDGSANPLEKTFRGKGYRHAMQQHLVYYEKKGVL